MLRRRTRRLWRGEERGPDQGTRQGRFTVQRRSVREQYADIRSVTGLRHRPAPRARPRRPRRGRPGASADDRPPAPPRGCSALFPRARALFCTRALAARSRARVAAAMVHAALFISPSSSCETARIFVCSCMYISMSYHYSKYEFLGPESDLERYSFRSSSSSSLLVCLDGIFRRRVLFNR